MADGFQIEIDAEMAERLKAAAQAAGVEPATYALEVLGSALDSDWTESLKRLEEYDRTGESISLEEALKEFHGAVEDELRSKE